MEPVLIKHYIEQGLECEHVEVAGDGHHFEAIVVSALFQGKPKVRQQCATLLGELDDPAAVEALRKASKDGETTVATAAKTALMVFVDP